MKIYSYNTFNHGGHGVSRRNLINTPCLSVYSVVIFFMIYLFSAFHVFAQDVFETSEETEIIRPDFLIIPIVETISRGQVTWNPLMPPHVPPCAFFVKGEKLPTAIELSNENDDVPLAVKRDNQGRLTEFPFLIMNNFAKIEVEYYNDSLSLKTINLTIKTVVSEDEPIESEIIEGGQEQEETVYSITFPENFYPYSNLSPGGSFPSIRITSGEVTYHVFIFETPSFLTETWYDDYGNMLLFCRADIDKASSWRVRSLHIHENENTRFIDYYFDSYGNITEIRNDEGVFSALYRNKLPVNWQYSGVRSEFQWDTQGNLMVFRSLDTENNVYTEFRYSYDFDDDGNWTVRRETALTDLVNLLVPLPSLVRGTWTRKIIWE